MPRERLCAFSELSAERGREFVVGDRIIAAYRVDGQVYAIDGICAHAGGPLAQGAVCQHFVTCPWHGWQYDIRTGQHRLNPRVQVQSFAVTVEGDDVFIDIG